MKRLITIAIGTDHRGFHLKEFIKGHLNFDNYDIRWFDVGAFNEDRSDYPEFSFAVAHELLKGTASYGILLCGTGTGMAIAANRFPTIFAGVAWNEEVARLCKEDDNVNVLVIPADYCSNELSIAMLQAWFNAEFKHNRYEDRIAMINQLYI